MSSIVVSGDTSGAITLAAPAVAGTNTLTLPANTGTVLTTASVYGTTGPAFSAYQSSAQTLGTNTYTKIQFQTEEFDTNNNFDNSTNYRFTPTVAGYYQVSGGIALGSSAASIGLQVYKNGTAFKSLGSSYATSISWLYGSCLIYLNGSTDYIELWAQTSTGQALYTASAANTYFQAVMVRGA